MWPRSRSIESVVVHLFRLSPPLEVRGEGGGERSDDSFAVSDVWDVTDFAKKILKFRFWEILRRVALTFQRLTKDGVLSTKVDLKSLICFLGLYFFEM